MSNKEQLAKIKDEYTRQEQEAGIKMLQLVNDHLASEIDPNAIIERLREIRKSYDDFEVAVEHVAAKREYDEFSNDAAGCTTAAHRDGMPRFAAVPLYKPAAEIRARTELFLRCIPELRKVAKVRIANASLEELEKEIQQLEEAFNAAEKNLMDGRKRLKDPLIQARGAVSQCDHAFDRLIKIANAPTDRELELQQMRADLINPTQQGNEYFRTQKQKRVAEVDEEITAERASKFEPTDDASQRAADSPKRVASRKVRTQTPRELELIRMRAELLNPNLRGYGRDIDGELALIDEELKALRDADSPQANSETAD